MATDSSNNGWSTVTIGDIANVIGGGTPSTKDPTNFGGDIPWLTPKDLSGIHDRHMSYGARNLTAKGLESSSAKLVPRGTVLLTTRAPVGYVAIAEREVSTNQGFRNLVVREGFNAEYLYYWLISNTEELRRNASGSTFGELSGSALKRIEIPLPPLPEQRRIARILGALDDKIELNRRMNETLEEMARAIFADWFVDFGPVRAKMDGREAYLPEDVWRLFPDRLVESELGLVPEGWGVRRLGDCVSTVPGRSYRSAELSDSNTALVTFKSMKRGGGYSPDGLKSYTGRYKPEQVIRLGEVVVSHTDVTQAAEVIGRVARVGATRKYETLVASLDMVIVRPGDCLNASYLFHLLDSHEFYHHCLSYVNGTTVLHLNKQAVHEFRFVLPGKNVLTAFAAQVEQSHTLCDTNEVRSEHLAKVRDELLPALISDGILPTS